MKTNDFNDSLRALLAYAVENPDEAVTDILARYADFPSFAAADIEELAAIRSVGQNGASLIRLAFALRARSAEDKFAFGKKHTEEEIVDFLKAVFYPLSNETVFALLFDGGGRVISLECMGVGTINSAGVLPRQFLEVALKKNAAAVVIAHNHPAGFPAPSSEDVATTSLVESLLESAGRKLIAHYVIAGNESSRV